MTRTVLVLARHELRLFASLALWVARRRHGVGEGVAFGYARGQGPVMFGFAFVCVVESVTMAVLLRDYPAAHRGVFMLDVYTIVLVIGMHAASVVRPHVLDAGSLRIRRAAHVDLRIPLEKVESVRRELRTTHERAEGELDVVIGAQTSVTLELAEPVAHFTFLGRRRDVRLVRFHADDADSLVRELHAVRQTRTAPSALPSPLPDQPG
ncbi:MULTISPECIES: hypothetical protein [unclassified Streptomyces]|uniref:hypothetical protein n=1 Tax=unclassified Streptomyces TaxID=2593676 RepID=UPI00236530C9|nr:MULTISPECIES: hypothetical protein [unclassified Streptomyces]MDF3143895.1 hypothetical protein [Streptomyces sp. T21Q-yed]WDF37666.1 hypothetical protein PBV52_13055 [Streptomyces sp. T12]